MSKYRSLNGTRLEQISDSLGTSEELLDAIETVSGATFFYETHDENSASPSEELAENEALSLCENGGREDEILAALPINSAEENDEVLWGNDKFAEFDGEKWIKDENF